MKMNDPFWGDIGKGEQSYELINYHLLFLKVDMQILESTFRERTINIISQTVHIQTACLFVPF